jgi:hypothetical protein
LPSQPVRDAIGAIQRTAVNIGAVTTRTPTLDDIYLQLTGQSLTGEPTLPGDLEAA